MSSGTTSMIRIGICRRFIVVAPPSFTSPAEDRSAQTCLRGCRRFRNHIHSRRSPHLASHRSPVQRPQNNDLAHRRRLSANERALCAATKCHDKRPASGVRIRRVPFTVVRRCKPNSHIQSPPLNKQTSSHACHLRARPQVHLTCPYPTPPFPSSLHYTCSLHYPFPDQTPTPTRSPPPTAGAAPRRAPGAPPTYPDPAPCTSCPY